MLLWIVSYAGFVFAIVAAPSREDAAEIALHQFGPGCRLSESRAS